MELILRNVNIDGEIKDIAIEGATVTMVAPSIERPAKRIIDAQNRVGIQGFANCHMHIDKCNLYEYGTYEDLTGPEKGALTRKAKEHFTVENIIRRAESLIKESIELGTLHVRTNVDVDPIVGLKGIEALLQLKEKYADVLDLQIAAFAQEGFSKYPQTKELLDEALSMGADLIGGHTIVDGAESQRHIDSIFELAQKHEKEIDFHLDESGNREHYLLPYITRKMIDTGYQGKVNGIHCCTLSALTQEELEEALQLIVESKLKVTVAPTAISTRNLAPVKKLMELGVTLGLATDNIGDYFNPLGSPSVVQMGQLLSYVQRFFTEEEIAAIWNWCTVGGSRLIGRNQEIKEGSAADITILDALSPKLAIARGAHAFTVVRKGKVLR